MTDRESNPLPLRCMSGDSTTRLKRSAVMSGTGIHRLIYRDICVERGASYAACCSQHDPYVRSMPLRRGWCGRRRGRRLGRRGGRERPAHHAGTAALLTTAAVKGGAGAAGNNSSLGLLARRCVRGGREREREMYVCIDVCMFTYTDIHGPDIYIYVCI